MSAAAQKIIHIRSSCKFPEDPAPIVCRFSATPPEQSASPGKLHAFLFHKTAVVLVLRLTSQSHPRS